MINNKNILLQPLYHSKVKKQDNSLNFDVFTFVDRLTSNKLTFQQAKKSKQSNNLNQFQDQTDLQCLQKYITVLQNTKAFQMLSLRQKIFKTSKMVNKIQNNVSQNIITMNVIRYKNQLKKLVMKSIDDINRKQFKQVIRQQHKSIPLNVIQINQQAKKINTSINKNLITKLCDFQNKSESLTNKKQIINNKNSEIRDEIGKFQIQYFDENLVKSINQNILPIKQSYLVQPSLKTRRKRILIDVHKKFKEKKILNQEKQNINISNLSWQQIHLSQLATQLEIKNKIKTNTVKNKRNLLELVGQNSIVSVQLQLLIGNMQIDVKDRRDNNIFHLATKSNNCEMIQLLLNKIHPKQCIQLLQQHNKYNRTPVDLANIFAAKNIIKLYKSYIESQIQ